VESFKVLLFLIKMVVSFVYSRLQNGKLNNAKTIDGTGVKEVEYRCVERTLPGNIP
jgi:hypothetical protein